MEGTRKIQCSCGQENQLVLLDDKWHYDASRHGNGEPCEGKCFNCRAPLKDDELFPVAVETAETPGTPEEPEPSEGPKEASMSMNRKELLERAEEMGLEVPTGAKKADILELIEQAPETENQEPEGE